MINLPEAFVFCRSNQATLLKSLINWAHKIPVILKVYRKKSIFVQFNLNPTK